MSIKKAQIGVFVVVATILVIIFAFIFTFTKSDVLVSKLDEKEVKFFLDSCYKSSFKNSVKVVSFNGGIFYPYENFSYDKIEDFLDYSFYMNRIDNYDLTLDISQIEENISEGIYFYFKSCIDDHSYLNITASKENFTITTKITENSILSNSKIPVRVSDGYKDLYFTKFDYGEDTNVLYRYYRASKVISKEIFSESGMYCISCINDVIESYNLKYLQKKNVVGNISIITIILSDEKSRYAYYGNRYILMGDQQK